MGQEIVLVQCGDGESLRCVVPVGILAASMSEAREQADDVKQLLESLGSEGIETIVVTEDRWRSQGDMMRARLLAFLEEHHSYGDAACRYRYGLYLRRPSRDGKFEAGTLVAVATFSNARKWIKGEKTIRSYEWTRYASLPSVRISGGMGKMLKAFIKEVEPDDIMSYADLEWSEGNVYEQLGFVLEGQKEPVMFGIDSEWNRSPVKTGMTGTNLFYMNFGSNKYRLKLTEYE